MKYAYSCYQVARQHTAAFPRQAVAAPRRRSMPSLLRRRAAFTLIEAALVTSIIGVGVIAMMQLLAAGTVSNVASADLTSGLNLANNIRELSQGLRFAESDSATTWGLEAGETRFTADDVDDLDGQVFSPPIDARRINLGGDFSHWAQSIKVEAVDPNYLKTPTGHAGLTPDQRPVNRVTVAVTKNQQPVCEVSWLVVYIRP